MRKHLRHAFVPHEGNRHHAHVLRPHRALFWSFFGIAIKCIAVLYALLLPAEVFVMPDVLSEASGRVLSVMNDIRAHKELPAFVEDSRLQNSALAKSMDMAGQGYFAHTSPQGFSLAYWLKKERYPYTVAGENLAIGFTDADEVVTAWKESHTHYANIIDPEFVDAGVGMAGGVYNGVPVVFTAAHFGATRQGEAAYHIQNNEKAVAGVTISEPVAVTENRVQVNNDMSGVFVDRHGNEVTFLATAVVSGPVSSAEVRVGGETIPLALVSPDGVFEGSVTVSSTLAGARATFSSPVLAVEDMSGKTIETRVGMEGLVVPAPTVRERYVAADRLFGSSDAVFVSVRFLYIFGIAVFGAGLLFHLAVDMRRHIFHHVTLQTVGLLFLLSTLLLV